MSNFNPIDDPDEFPEHFPKPIYVDLRYNGRLFLTSEDLAYIRNHQSIYIPYHNEYIATADAVAPSTWAWFKSLWK